jgi:ribosomal protein L20A (L18A)
MSTAKGSDAKKKVKEEVTLSDIVTLFGSYANLPNTQQNQDGAKNYNSKIPTLLLWINDILEPKGLTMTEMKGFHRGLELIYVLESLTHTNLTTKNVNPNTWSEQQTNCELVLRFSKHLGISTDNITGDELNSDNIPKVLLLIVRAALQVHATESALDAKDLKKKKKVDSKEPPQNVEVKLEQAKYDAILKEAAVRQEKLSQQDKDRDQGKKKGPTAMELISADPTQQRFYVVFEDGSKQAVPFKALQSLQEAVQNISEKFGYNLKDYTVTNMQGKPLLMSTKMTEVKDYSIKFLKKGSSQIVGAILSDDKQKVLSELLEDDSKTVVLSGRDVIAEESNKRAEKRQKEFVMLTAESAMSPALRELERQHKLLLKQLKVNQIRTVDKLDVKEVTLKEPSKVDTEPLNGVYVNLSTFSDKLGQRDQRHEPEAFFAGLVKVPTKRELDKMTKDEEAREAKDNKTSRRHKEVKDDDDDDDADHGIQFPATFLIQLETGGRLQVPFQKNATVKSGLDKIAVKNNLKLADWMYVTLTGQPIDPDTRMGKVPGFSIMCVKKA